MALPTVPPCRPARTPAGRRSRPRGRCRSLGDGLVAADGVAAHAMRAAGDADLDRPGGGVGEQVDAVVAHPPAPSAAGRRRQSSRPSVPASGPLTGRTRIRVRATIAGSPGACGGAGPASRSPTAPRGPGSPRRPARPGRRPSAGGTAGARPDTATVGTAGCATHRRNRASGRACWGVAPVGARPARAGCPHRRRRHRAGAGGDLAARRAAQAGLSGRGIAQTAHRVRAATGRRGARQRDGARLIRPGGPPGPRGRWGAEDLHARRERGHGQVVQCGLARWRRPAAREVSHAFLHGGTPRGYIW
ncbi:hypothetical protein SAMN05660642_04053 [Geodermatophilus siccatus]|uniref:Uncharacterized protein n=1 Tax=Geodermatophilus siccatus TaxID=1137991 RepID=A0A1G9YQ41_9ACTN|nr:hypothetical protein SAMN05660642_04053 [Geodermatophilus siccatus]